MRATYSRIDSKGASLRDNKIDGKFEISEEKLGKGSFGSVWRGINTETKEEVAIKVIKCFNGSCDGSVDSAPAL